MTLRTLRGQVAIAGVGETTYYRHGQSPDPEFKLALKAILAACEDAGIDPREIDGFSSYANDRNDPTRLAAALGLPRLRATLMQWGGGGGGCCAAVANGAAAIAAGMANCVVVFRALAQGAQGRFGHGVSTAQAPEMAWQTPYGVISPTQKYAMKIRRFMHEHGVRQEALRAIALASYYHAQANPRAVMHGKPLDAEKYDRSRWIVEPLHLYDCCMENDGAAAVVLVPADRAGGLRNRPAWLLGAASGSDHRGGAQPHNAPDYASAGYRGVAEDAFAMAGVGPSDVGVLQVYENFTGGVVMAMAEHGFFDPAEANEFLTLETLPAPAGRLPFNTSGGTLAECYMHGFELIVEATRQIRGTSTSQAARSDVSMVIGAPLVAPVSSLILGSEAVL
ncbi:MAG TPA: acetyl-CoA acetyltransferase [Burkholderiaceae bacterium]|nr:acetyl-CoA acetyltransferase [Burkholderiaceae bacterium]